jgi:hypothetical protein
MNMRALFLTALLCACAAQAQESKREMWTWTDQNGVTHFSDRPVPGARKVALAVTGPSSTEPAPAPASPSGPTEEQQVEGVESVARVEYRLLEFQQPTEGQTFFGPDAAVDVSLRTQPGLAAGHRLALYLDGAPVGNATNSTSYRISNLVRGTHTLTAVIQDERGNDLLRSQPRTFNVRQPTTIPPAAVGPNLKQPRPVPLPRPQPRPN